MSGSAVIGALRVILGMDSAAFETGAKQAENRLARLDTNVRKFGKGMVGFGDGLVRYGQTMSVVSGAIAGVATVAFGLAAGAAEAGDRVAKSARSAGVGAEYYQELAFAMGQVTDLTQDELDKGLLTLNRRLGEAKEGSKGAIDAFAAIGISQADIASGAVTTEQAMDRMITYLSDSTDASTAAAIAADLFGKTGARMGAQMAGSAGEIASLRTRAQELGIVMSQEALAASEQFGDKWSEVGKAVEGLKIKLANELLPILVDTVIPALLDTVIPAIGSVIDKIGEWIGWFGDLDPAIQSVVGWVTAAFAVGGPVVLAIGVVSSAIGGLIAATGPVGLLIAAASVLGTAWSIWGNDFKAAVGGAIEWVSEKFNGFLAMLQSIIDKAVAVKNAIADALKSDQAREAEARQADPLGAAGRGVVMDAANGMAAGTGAAEVESYLAGQKLGGAVIDGAKEKLDSHSPSRVFMGIGEDVMAGLGIGISDATDVPVNAMSFGIAQISSTLLGLGDVGDDTFRRLGGWMADLATGATTLGKTLQQTVDNWASSLRNSGLNGLTDILTGGMGKPGGDLVSGLLGGLFGFADGGSFQVGGVGGTDSQIVAFRASPNERVSITKPGQSFGGAAQSGGGGVLQIMLGDGLQAQWLQQAQGQAVQIVRAATPQIVNQSVGAVVKMSQQTKLALA